MSKEKKPKKVKKLKSSPNLKNISLDREELVEAREKRYILEMIVFVVIGAVLLILVYNKTFFKETYKNKSLNIEIPRFLFFVGDNNEEVKFKTLRKREYIEEYFTNYKYSLDYYFCNGNTYYYDQVNKNVIVDINIDKSFALKTVKVKYSSLSIDDLCVSNGETIGE